MNGSKPYNASGRTRTFPGILEPRELAEPDFPLSRLRADASARQAPTLSLGAHPYPCVGPLDTAGLARFLGPVQPGQP
jgi:hypothetical protein